MRGQAGEHILAVGDFFFTAHNPAASFVVIDTVALSVGPARRFFAARSITLPDTDQPHSEAIRAQRVLSRLLYLHLLFPRRASLPHAPGAD